LQPSIFEPLPNGKATAVPADPAPTTPQNPAMSVSQAVVWVSAASLVVAILFGLGFLLWRTLRS
jgi:hypothetical protein